VDIALPSAGGVALVRELASGPVDLHVILLASREDPAAALDGLRAGASGYLTKDMQLDAMARAVRAVVAGEPAISRHLVRALVDALREGGERARLRPVRSPLTSREWEVLDLLCEGYGTAAIAHRLVISPETVRSHVKRMNRKLGVSTREEAVVAAGELRGISTAGPGVLVRER
jgi:DNA-binding NarL/FixJ family response regulator